MEFQEGICKFCLEKDKYCRAIEGNVLSTLLPNIDFTVIQGPVICRNCEKMLIKCNDFKTKCLHTYKSVVSIVNKNIVKLNLKDAYVNRNATGTGIQEDQEICGFCLGPTKNVSTVSFDVEKETVMLGKMIKQCLPELDFSIVKKLVICASCNVSLENSFRFVTNCLIAEEKIKKYCSNLDVDSKSEIELSNVLQFIIRDVTSGEDVERQSCGDRKSPDEREIDRGEIIELERTFLEGYEHTYGGLKIKNEIFMETNEKDDCERWFTPKNVLALDDENCRLGFVKTEGLSREENEAEYREENLDETDDQECLPFEEVLIKTEENNFNRFEGSIVLPQREVATRLRREENCVMPHIEGDVTKPYIKEVPTNKSVSAATMLKCDTCLFQTKYKYSLKRHLVKHKDCSEVIMYKCECCSNQVNRKNCPKEAHLLKLKDPVEVTVYKCDSCLYQTRFKSDLNRHLLTHKYPSDVTMHKCDFCQYEAKHKHSLRVHLLKHQDPSEVTTYNCDSCSFQTKYKNNLVSHLLMHKDPSEVTTYKCVSCSFQTKYKTNLASHLLKQHQDPSEVTTYKCDSCSFQTKYKRGLKAHVLKHVH